MLVLAWWPKDIEAKVRCQEWILKSQRSGSQK